MKQSQEMPLTISVHWLQGLKFSAAHLDCYTVWDRHNESHQPKLECSDTIQLPSNTLQLKNSSQIQVWYN